MLIILTGLPGSGKTTIAKSVAEKIGATYIRIDTIEQAIQSSSLDISNVEESGYLVGYGVAKDNLLLGRTVIADSVNPIELSRNDWLGIAKEANAEAIEVEIICSDKEEHRKRLESRLPDLPHLPTLTWDEVMNWEYDPWSRDHVIIDTASKSISECCTELIEHIQSA